MGIFDEKLWCILKNKAIAEEIDLPSDQQISNEYITGIKKICEFGVNRASTIRDTFPMYTKHDVTHICNVMRLMISLLGDNVERLKRDEVAMLVMSACCHDIGMSYSEEDKSRLLADLDRLNKYLDQHHSEYVKAYANGGDIPIMTDDMMQNYLRSIHHERIVDLLSNFEWPVVLNGRVNREELMRVCQSHGEDISNLDELDSTDNIDLRLCSIMLRLADILDFDTTRAPQTLYDYCGFDNKTSNNALKSKEEWDKHLSSYGFDFTHITDRTYPYQLPYNAISMNMQVEQAINIYLDWVDQELDNCGKVMRRFTGEWKDVVLPGKVKRNIKSEGYVSGQYRLTLDQSQIMELLIGKDLYSDPAVFVRELIQNAIDAVRTREQLDKNLPCDWTPQIKIRTWMDGEGYHWFRIEDNGIGMTEETIKNFFLKVGCSYYTSDTFMQDKIRCKADPDYTPISRFGIGILSCFMGDEQANQVEVSTKHFKENGIYYPALRLSMHGMSGYYYMASKDKHHIPGPMKGFTNEEQEPYIANAGTIIAVRTNLYQTGKYKGFKEIVDRYVIYPPVSIHYDGSDGCFDYPTEENFMNAIENIQPSEDLSKQGLFEFPLSMNQINEISSERPEISFTEPPKLILKCIPLNRHTDSPYLNGATLAIKSIGDHKRITVKIGNRKIKFKVNVGYRINDESSMISLNINLTTSSAFEEKMRNIERFNYQYGTILSDLEDKLDGYYKEIAVALRYRDVYKTEWKKYFTLKYNIPLKELNKLIEKVKDDAEEKIDIDPINEEDINTFDVYKALRTRWSFNLFKLSDFDWYNKYFRSMPNKSVTAHNGIYCGNANFFSKMSYLNTTLGTILLLKDNYRPNVDIARDDIRSISLETACDLEIVKMNIQEIGFTLESNKLNETWYSFIPTIQYWDIFNNRADLLKKLIIPTEKGNLSLTQLRHTLNEYNSVLLSNTPTIGISTSYRNDTFYMSLCIAILRKEFSLRVELGSYTTRIYITNEDSKTIGSENESIFPPSFFIEPLGTASSYLTTQSHDYRYTCNAKHRFSMWFMNNGLELKRYVPGIFKEILRILAEEDAQELIRGVNDLLARLRSFPNSPFEIPDELFLKEKDFH